VPGIHSAAATTWIALGRHIGTATLAGAVAGIVVGGLLGRIAMRVSGFTAGPGLVGVRTSNGNAVGDITFEGTLALMLFVGLGTGLVGGLLYAALEPSIRDLRPWHGLAYGAALLAAFGFTVLDPGNIDFRRFGLAPLNVAMFAALFLVFGIAQAWLFDRLGAIIAGPGRLARATQMLAWLSLVPAAVVTALVAVSVGGLDEPIPAILALGAVLIAVIARSRGLPALVGYAALAVPVALGLARTVSALPELLAGF
jgi:hypothetical protein